jgi:hypothetical protein
MMTTTSVYTGLAAFVMSLSIPALAGAQAAPAKTLPAEAAAAPAKAAPAPAAKAVPTSFNWYAEVVTFDAASRTLTARAKVEPHVTGRVSHLKAGERVVLGWSAFNGEADAVRSVTAEKAMAAESGYLVRATLVSVDAPGQTMTFTTKVPVAAATALGPAKAGTPVRVAAPLVQPGPDAGITAVALGKTAPTRPVAVAVAKPVESARQVAGEWSVSTNMMGNAIKLQCKFTQAGSKLDGTCNGPGPFANLPANGKIDGNDVSFGFAISQPVSLTLLHRGKLDATGTLVEGTLDLMGNLTPFTAVRQQSYGN